MKGVVTGGGGFLGRPVLRALIRSGWEVVNLDLRAVSDVEGVANVAGDYRDPEILRKALSRADAVFHLACSTYPGDSEADPARDVEDNVVGLLRLLRSASELGVRRFVFSSSGGTVYGVPREIPVPEEHPTVPISSHGVMKLACEHYLRLWARSEGRTSVILRLSNPYGPGQNPARGQGIVAAALDRALRGRPLEVWGDGSAVRDFVYVEDAADAFARAGGHPSSDVFNVGSGTGVAVRDLLDAARRATGRPLEVRYAPRRLLDVPLNVLDVRKARRVLGWSPRVPLEEGLRRTAEAFARASGG